MTAASRISFGVRTFVVVLVVGLVGCGGGGGKGSADPAKFCNDLRTVIVAIDSMGAGNIAPPGKSELTSLSSKMRALVNEAPAEVKADVSTMADFFQKASEHGLGSVDDATNAAGNAAGERLDTFASSKCGASPDEGSGAAAPISVENSPPTSGPTTTSVVKSSSDFWSAPQAIDPKGDLERISCPTDTFCVAVDHGGAVVTYDGNKWSSPTQVGGSYPDVSCVSNRFCMLTSSSGEVFRFDGATWTPAKVFRPGAYSVVSCATVTSCAAVDVQSGIPATFDGSTWTAGSTSISEGPFVAVSCPASGSCAAVEGFGGTDQILTLTGGTWSGVAIPGDSGREAFKDLSCPSPNFCMVVNEAGSKYATFDGTAWTPWNKVDDTNSFHAITCTAATSCAGLDNSGRVATFDGSAWSAAEVIDPAGHKADISCATSKFCVAVGAHTAVVGRR